MQSLLIVCLWLIVGISTPSTINSTVEDTIWMTTDSTLHHVLDDYRSPQVFELSDSCAKEGILYGITDVIPVLPEENTPQIIQIHEKRDTKDTTTILFYLLLAALTIFAFAKYAYQNYVSKTWRSFTNFNLATQFYEDTLHMKKPVELLLSINRILILSVLFFLLARYFYPTPPFNDLTLWLIILGIVAVLSILRNAALQFLAFILPIGDRIHFYHFNLELAINIFSISLLPLLFIFAFSQQFIKSYVLIGVVCLTIIYLLYRSFRGFLVSRDLLPFHKFHFFVYLCTFEIAPLIILYKILGKLIDMIV